ncbi:unnamed protein product [Lampetra planeri]
MPVRWFKLLDEISGGPAMETHDGAAVKGGEGTRRSRDSHGRGRRSGDGINSRVMIARRAMASSRGREESRRLGAAFISSGLFRAHVAAHDTAAADHFAANDADDDVAASDADDADDDVTNDAADDDADHADDDAADNDNADDDVTNDAADDDADDDAADNDNADDDVTNDAADDDADDADDDAGDDVTNDAAADDDADDATAWPEAAAAALNKVVPIVQVPRQEIELATSGLQGGCAADQDTAAKRGGEMERDRGRERCRWGE